MNQSFKFIQAERQTLETLSCRKLTIQEAFEAEQDLLGAINWLIEMDRKYNPELYRKEGVC